MLEGGDIMLRIAICDDIPEQLDIMEKAVLSYFSSDSQEIRISKYHNAMEFLDIPFDK